MDARVLALALGALASSCAASHEPGGDAGGDAPRAPGREAGPPVDAPARDARVLDVLSTPACGIGPGGCDVVLGDCPADPSGARVSCQVVVDGAGSLGTRSARVDVPGAEAAPCTTGAECAPGLFCAPGIPGSACRALCCAAAGGVCPAGRWCIPIAGASGEPTGIGACFPEGGCSVVPQSGCLPGQACVPLDESTTSCVTAGSVPPGEACDRTAPCAPGAVCVGTMDGPYACRLLCRLDVAPCAPRSTCTSVGGLPGPYGACLPS